MRGSAVAPAATNPSTTSGSCDRRNRFSRPQHVTSLPFAEGGTGRTYHVFPDRSLRLVGKPDTLSSGMRPKDRARSGSASGVLLQASGARTPM
ncbi:uncharacterized protein M421DRAFT_125957 [Didymella exigua CBS 183.55]|uniref:Uncharacterized protein n=1 Tax=Didymella exigua CBS 183.55 TaxID=1150837 RepID=A0A6A5RML5_9PLEO|nr:uncharacterized protein M421DRAFT_125957 [Didymella exigua CBS 183.55]KAF1929651.1 hypothetical protein M421DRAFT_125957 [Didymella exigua CBS 183.55]